MSVPSCATAGAGWCVARRFSGTDAIGELGFRFGEPLDADGDGQADVAAGARFKHGPERLQNGSATVWSGATGDVIRTWDGGWPDAFFGHSVLLIPDISGDGLADVIIAVPHAGDTGPGRGIIVARSPKTGRELWRRVEVESENLGWDLALAGDQDGDGHVDVFAGAPSGETGRVYLLSGLTGTIIRTYAPAQRGETFGWYVARLDDIDGDGHPDLAVGGPSAPDAQGTPRGAAWLFSSRGRELREWHGTDPRGGFGTVVTAVADLDGDGRGDLAVAAPGSEDPQRSLPGELFVYSSHTGKQLRHWTGTQPGELLGRMVVSTPDLDGDGIDDLAIAAPKYRRGADDLVGRVELRSARTGKVLDQFFGETADSWFGWHIRRAPDPGGRHRPALLIGSLRHPVDGKVAVGVIDLYVRRPVESGGRAQGTMTRGTRRNDIR